MPSRPPVVHDDRPAAVRAVLRDVEAAGAPVSAAFHVAAERLAAIADPRKVKAGEERAAAVAALEAVDRALGLAE